MNNATPQQAPAARSAQAQASTRSRLYRFLRIVFGFLLIAGVLDLITIVRLEGYGTIEAYLQLVFLLAIFACGFGVASIARYRIQAKPIFLYFAGLFLLLGLMYGSAYIAANAAHLQQRALHPYLLWLIGRCAFVLFFLGGVVLLRRKKVLPTPHLLLVIAGVNALIFLSSRALYVVESRILGLHAGFIGRPWEVVPFVGLLAASIFLSRVYKNREEDAENAWIFLFFGFQVLASGIMFLSQQELDLWFFFAFLLQLTGFCALPFGFVTELTALFREREQLLLHVQTQKSLILQEEARLSAVVDALPIGFALLRGKGLQVVLMNAHMAHIFDGEQLPFADAKGLIRRFAIQHHDGTPYTPAELAPAMVLRTKKSVVDEGVVMSGSAGDRRYVRMVGAPICDAKGAVIMVILLAEDISERMRLTQQLTDRENALLSAYERSKEHEKEIVRLKDEFVFVAAHELRAPVNAIRWNIEFMREQQAAALSKDVQARLGDIDQASGQLLLLVEDLLHVARLDEGTVQITPQPCALQPIIADAVRLVTPMAEKAGIRLIAPAADGTVYADPRRVTEVVQNMLTNAVKYNRPQGTVTVEVGEEQGQTVIRVRDTGIGIAPADIPKMFTKFFRVQRTETKDVEGTGLGLFIVQKLLQRMGGDIRVESTLNVGSTFIVTLPKAPPAAV